MVILPKVKSVCYPTSFQDLFMVSLGSIRSASLVCLLALSTAVASIALRSEVVRAQTPTVPEGGSSSTPDQSGTTAPNNEDLRPLSQGSVILSIPGGQRLMQEASSAVSAQNYDLAVQKLQEARQVFNQLSNFYQDLAASFSGIDVRIADDQRRQAVETAQMRDEATYQLALVHRAQNKPELAVPLLVQIIRSQNPTRDLGKRAYQQLYELGFVSSPFPRNRDEGGNSSEPPQTQVGQ